MPVALGSVTLPGSPASSAGLSAGYARTNKLAPANMPGAPVLT